MSSSHLWPEGKRFAFTVFDDPDSQTVADGREVYACLRDLGFRTTKGIWPLGAVRDPSDHGGTCAEEDYRLWAQGLQTEGFEIGFHNATNHTSYRLETIRGLDQMRELFGATPVTMAQHYHCRENIYWGSNRLTGLARRSVYNLATRFANHGRFRGEFPTDELFWGDACASRVFAVRNFVFAGMNTLRHCPFMPYFDPMRPYVQRWYCSSEGSNVQSFNATITEREQDRLVSEEGACIMYTHFGHGFVQQGKLNREFVRLMTRLAGLGGWFVPVWGRLAHLEQRAGGLHPISDAERSTLEWRWLRHKLRYGTA
jgi:hypothetical protein